LTIVFQLTGTLFLFLAFYQLWVDIRSDAAPPFAFILVSYFGILPLYTTDNSLRYYFIACALLALYFALRYNGRGLGRPALVLWLIVSLGLTNISQIGALIHRNRPIAPITFTVGNGQQETSAHFLPSKPLIDFLRHNAADDIFYLSDRYFLEQPIRFHYSIAPWTKEPGRTAIVGYDDSGGNGGYLLHVRE